MPQVQAYSYADPTGFGTTNFVIVNLGGGAVGIKTLAPLVWAAFLLDLKARLDAATGQVWTVAYSATTRRVTISVAAGAFTLDFGGNTAQFLGFNSAPYGAAASHVGEVAPAGVGELLAVECEAPENADDAQPQSLRHGRNVVPLFGNHQIQRLKLLGQTGKLPVQTAYLLAGRIRVYPTTDAAAYDPATHLGGYVDGYIVEQPSLEQPDLEGDLIEFGLTLAVAR